MKNIAIVLGLALAGAQAALASETLQGDPAAGKAQAASCGACHGADGNSAAPSFPKLAGLGEKYLLKQMKDIRDGARPVPTMAGQVDNKTDQQLADLAAYFDSQPRGLGQTDPELAELGEKIYRAGVAERGVPACTACHSPTGQGNGPAGFPALGGQHAEYVEAQLKAYRKGYEDPSGRTNDGDAMIMRITAFGLSDLEIKAVASYVTGLH